MIKLFIAVSLLLTCQQVARSQEVAPVMGDADLLEVTIFALQHEAEASDLNKRRDVCVSLDTRLGISEKDVASLLKADGLAVHLQEWCNRGPRGYSLFVHAPINRTDEGTYEVTIQVGDLKIEPGVHFATLLKDGTYLIHYDGKSGPKLVSYKQKCCPRAK